MYQYILDEEGEGKANGKETMTLVVVWNSGFVHNLTIAVEETSAGNLTQTHAHKLNSYSNIYIYINERYKLMNVLFHN